MTLCLPTTAQHTLATFPEESLLVVTADPAWPNLCITPAPPFFEGDALLMVHTPQLPQMRCTPLLPDDTPPVTLRLRFTSAPGPLPATAAILLDDTELAWVRRLYLGNVLEEGAQDTCCAGCAGVLIRRYGTKLLDNTVHHGGCLTCGTALAGRGL